MNIQADREVEHDSFRVMSVTFEASSSMAELQDLAARQ